MKPYLTPLFICALLASTALSGDHSPPEFLLIESSNKWNSIYEDVLFHSDKSFTNEQGRPTNVHETAHFIHSRERNRHSAKIGKCNAFYCLDGRVVVLREPRLTMRHIFIPEALRANRYKLYFEKQLEYWEDTPTYPMEEWSSYILGAECAMEDHEKGVATTVFDEVSGCLEFSVYALGTAMAVKKIDRDYWDKEFNFKRFVRFNLSRAEKAFLKGRHIFKSQAQERLLENFRKHPDGEDMRLFMHKEFGCFFMRDQ